jgi:hypothetical protein
MRGLQRFIQPDVFQPETPGDPGGAPNIRLFVRAERESRKCFARIREKECEEKPGVEPAGKSKTQRSVPHAGGTEE